MITAFGHGANLITNPVQLLFDIPERVQKLFIQHQTPLFYFASEVATRPDAVLRKEDGQRFQRLQQVLVIFDAALQYFVEFARDRIVALTLLGQLGLRECS